MYENQLGILRRDNEQLRSRDAEATAARRRLHAALEISEGEDAATLAKRWRAELHAARARIAQLETALGIGPNDDPSVHRGLSNVEDGSTLPAYGQLLRMTALARTSPFLQGRYNAAPTQLHTPEGDLWTSGIEEVLSNDGTPIRVVVVRHEPGAYAQQEARIRLAQLESDLAAAIRENAMAAKRSTANHGGVPPDLRKAAESQRAEARKRGEEIQAEIERLRPLAAEPEAREWRFAADFDATGASVSVERDPSQEPA